jgi:hypothetical protein
LDPDEGFDEGFFPEAKNPIPQVTEAAKITTAQKKETS